MATPPVFSHFAHSTATIDPYGTGVQHGVLHDRHSEVSEFCWLAEARREEGRGEESGADPFSFVGVEWHGREWK